MRGPSPPICQGAVSNAWMSRPRGKQCKEKAQLKVYFEFPSTVTGDCQGWFNMVIRPNMAMNSMNLMLQQRMAKGSEHLRTSQNPAVFTTPWSCLLRMSTELFPAFEKLPSAVELIGATAKRAGGISKTKTARPASKFGIAYAILLFASFIPWLSTTIPDFCVLLWASCFLVAPNGQSIRKQNSQTLLLVETLLEPLLKSSVTKSNWSLSRSPANSNWQVHK